MIKPDWFDAFFILRPTLFFPSWTFFLAGYSRGEGSGVAFILMWLAAALGTSFLLNQLSDRREDRLNDKLWPLWGELIPIRTIYVELAILILLTILGGIWAGPELSALLALFFLIAGVFYNFPPLRLKGRPLLGIAACAVGVWIGYLIGARAASVPFLRAISWGLPYALAGAAVSLLTHVPDLEGDRRAGVRTFPTVYGLRRTGMWAAGLVGLCIVLSWFFSDYVLFVASVISAPFFVRFSVQPSAERADLAVKISVLVLAITVGLTWPPFLAMIACYYLFSRWYHRRRLGLDYPSFRTRRLGRDDEALRAADLERAEMV